MKTLKDTLNACIETWDDPGDYPSNAGSGPLPSRQWVAAVEGELEVQLEADDLEVIAAIRKEEPELSELEAVAVFVNSEAEPDYNLCEAKVLSWEVLSWDHQSNKLTLQAALFSAEDVE